MANTSPKSQPATSEPKTRQGERQTSAERTTTQHANGAGDMPHEQEQGESKRRPAARDVKQRRATVAGRNRQQEKKGKTRAATVDQDEVRPGRQPTKPKGRGKAKRKPRTGKSARAGSRRSRSPSTRKNTRSRATARR